MFYHTTPYYRAWAVPWFTWDGVGGDEIIDGMDSLGLEGYLCATYDICLK